MSTPVNKAAWLVAKQTKPLEVKEAEYPSAGEGEIVVQNRAVAINPADWLQQELAIFPLPYPLILGFDAAGEVVEVGSGVSRFKVGDRVLGQPRGLGGMSNREGGFQLYTVLKEKCCSQIPESMSFEAAAVLPLGVATAATGYYMPGHLDLELPSLEPKPTGQVILVWGGSSSVGCNGIQLAKFSGYEVFTTASPKNFDYLKEIGASQVFDYHDPKVVDQIAEALKGKFIAGVLDCIGTLDVLDSCADVLRKSEGRKLIARVKRGVTELPGGIQVKFIFGNLTDDKISKAIFEDFLPTALAEGKYRPAPDPVVAGHGLEAIQEAMEAQKKVSAQKIIVTL